MVLSEEKSQYELKLEKSSDKIYKEVDSLNKGISAYYKKVFEVYRNTGKPINSNGFKLLSSEDELKIKVFKPFNNAWIDFEDKYLKEVEEDTNLSKSYFPKFIKSIEGLLDKGINSVDEFSSEHITIKPSHVTDIFDINGKHNKKVKRQIKKNFPNVESLSNNRGPDPILEYDDLQGFISKLNHILFSESKKYKVNMSESDLNNVFDKCLQKIDSLIVKENKKMIIEDKKRIINAMNEIK